MTPPVINETFQRRASVEDRLQEPLRPIVAPTANLIDIDPPINQQNGYQRDVQRQEPYLQRPYNEVPSAPLSTTVSQPTWEDMVRIITAQNSQKVNVPPREIPKFSGRPEDAEEWLENYSSGATANGWDDILKRKQLPYYMESGSARNWFRHHIEASRQHIDWNDFQRQFRYVFIIIISVTQVFRYFLMKSQSLHIM